MENMGNMHPLWLLACLTSCQGRYDSPIPTHPISGHSLSRYVKNSISGSMQFLWLDCKALAATFFASF